MILRIETLREDVDIELLQFGFQHELVVPDADVSQCVEGVILDVPRLVSHEEEHSLKDLQNGIGARLERKAKTQ